MKSEEEQVSRAEKAVRHRQAQAAVAGDTATAERAEQTQTDAERSGLQNTSCLCVRDSLPLAAVALQAGLGRLWLFRARHLHWPHNREFSNRRQATFLAFAPEILKSKAKEK